MEHRAVAALPLAENPSTHWMEGWVGPRAGLDVFGEEKNVLSLPKFQFQAVHPIA
jgi:hypothetical protein